MKAISAYVADHNSGAKPFVWTKSAKTILKKPSRIDRSCGRDATESRVIQRHVEGLSYIEIAEMLSQPVGTAKANVHRGLAVLRSAYALGGTS